MCLIISTTRKTKSYKIRGKDNLDINEKLMDKINKRLVSIRKGIIDAANRLIDRNKEEQLKRINTVI